MRGSGPVRGAEMKTSICVFAGPSGGHLFPALSFLEAYLKNLPGETQAYLFTSRRAEKILRQISSLKQVKVVWLPEFPFLFEISFKSFLAICNFLAAFVLTLWHLLRIRPGLSVGFGSFIAFPGIVLSKGLRIPTLIHEQNFVPGKATKLLTGFADKIAVSFKETFQGNPKTVFTGLPLRRSMVEASKSCRSKPGEDGRNRFRVLIVGGSQGAKRLNEIIGQTFQLFSIEEKQKIAVIHITGMTDYDKMTVFYGKLGIDARVYSFFEKMEELYGQADMAITRAGANTVFELALFGLPAVAIPYPFAEGHQQKNTSPFTSQNVMKCYQESELTPEVLKREILFLEKNREERSRISERLKTFACWDASEQLVLIARRLLDKDKQ